MADIAAAMFNMITTDSGVIALMGTRLIPSYNRQGDRTYPLAVYKLDIAPAPAFDGESGIEYGTLQIAAVATTYAQATALATAIRSAIDQKSGTFAGTEVQGVFMQENGIRDDTMTDESTEAILFHIKEMNFDLAYTT